VWVNSVSVTGTHLHKDHTQILSDPCWRVTRTRGSRYPRVFPRVYPRVLVKDPDSCPALTTSKTQPPRHPTPPPNANPTATAATTPFERKRAAQPLPHRRMWATATSPAVTSARTFNPPPPPRHQHPRTIPAPRAPSKWRTRDRTPTTRHRGCPTWITTADRGREDRGKLPQPILPSPER